MSYWKRGVIGPEGHEQNVPSEEVSEQLDFIPAKIQVSLYREERCLTPLQSLHQNG